MAYGLESTTDEVLAGVDLSGKTVLVTGGSGGLGLETARALAAVGADLVLPIRSMHKADAAVDHIRGSAPDATVEVSEMDLASLDSVRAFADRFLAAHDRLDLLINNAGVMATPLGRTADGFELQFGTNHLGHFVLTGHLLPALVAAAPSRIVNLSSGGHRSSDIGWDDPNYEQRTYEKWKAYGQAKTANVLFSVELERRYGDRGVHAYSVHPGMIVTDLGRHLTRQDLTELMARVPKGKGGVPRKSVEAGAATTVWAATASELGAHGGAYCEDCAVGEPQREGSAGGYAPWAMDPASARRLWALSEELVGESFG